MSATVHVCFKAKPKCYAVMWSYGEICVGCSCCGKPSRVRSEARLEYWTEQLQHDVSFDAWCDDPKVRKAQEINMAANARHARRMVAYYTKRVASGGPQQ